MFSGGEMLEELPPVFYPALANFGELLCTNFAMGRKILLA